MTFSLYIVAIAIIIDIFFIISYGLGYNFFDKISPGNMQNEGDLFLFHIGMHIPMINIGIIGSIIVWYFFKGLSSGFHSFFEILDELHSKNKRN